MSKLDLETRRARCLHVSYDDLLQGFRRVGIHPGDTVYCHSSLSKFGYVEGGAATVVAALSASLGPTGTLAAPAGTYSLKRTPNPVFDVRHAPSELGTIAEAIRQRSTHRSHHVVESVSALGARAAELTSTHSLTNCGRGKPLPKAHCLGRPDSPARRFPQLEHDVRGRRGGAGTRVRRIHQATERPDR